MWYELSLEVLFFVFWYRKYSSANSPVATPWLIISVKPGSVVPEGMFQKCCCLHPHYNRTVGWYCWAVSGFRIRAERQYLTVSLSWELELRVKCKKVSPLREVVRGCWPSLYHWTLWIFLEHRRGASAFILAWALCCYEFIIFIFFLGSTTCIIVPWFKARLRNDFDFLLLHPISL